MSELVQVTSIANRLRTAMTLRNKKQSDLVRETEIGRSAICRYLSGEYEPKSKPIYELAKALDVSEEWLMGYDVPMQRTKLQNNNDAIIDIVATLKSDEDFLSLVKALQGIDKEKRKLIYDILNAFQK